LKKEFRSFEDARKFVCTLGIKNQKQWSTYCKSGNKPDDIPTTPSRTYKSKWISWGDFLGTGYVAHHNRKFRTFEKCQEFVYSLKLNTVKEWNQYCNSGNKPENIPNNPQRTYKKEWTSWGDFLGTRRVATHLKQYRTFQDVKNYVHDLGLKNQKKWREFVKSGKFPKDIPANPNQVYKDKGWTSWGDFFGVYRIGAGIKKYVTFEDAREFAHTLVLTGANEWRTFAKSNRLPSDIPKNPNQVYKDKGWTSWGDWTGTNVVATYNKKYRNFTEAKEFARSLGLKTANEWRVFVKSRKLPKDIPHGPNLTYRNKGWTSWGDFLGTGTIATTKKEFLPWKEAKSLYQKIAKENKITTRKQWEKYIKTHKLPKNLPPFPIKIYTKEKVRKMMK